MATFNPERMASDVVDAAKRFLARGIAPLQEGQRGLIARADKLAATAESLVPPVASGDAPAEPSEPHQGSRDTMTPTDTLPAAVDVDPVGV